LFQDIEDLGCSYAGGEDGRRRRLHGKRFWKRQPSDADDEAELLSCGHIAQVVTLAEHDAIVSPNVVGRRDVGIEIRQGEARQVLPWYQTNDGRARFHLDFSVLLSRKPISGMRFDIRRCPPNAVVQLVEGYLVVLAPTSRAVARFAVSHAACTCPVSVNMSGNNRAVSRADGVILWPAACASPLRNNSERTA